MLAAAGGSQPPPGGGGNDQHHARFHYSLRKRTNLKRKKTADGTSDGTSDGTPPFQSKVAERAWRTPPVSDWVNKKKRSFVKFGVKTVVVHKLYTGDKNGKGVLGTDNGKGKASETGGKGKGKASETGGKGKGKASETGGKGKGKASETGGEGKGHGYSTRSKSQSTSAVPNLDGQDDSRVQGKEADISELKMDELPDAESVAVHMLTILRKYPPRRD